MRPFFSTAVATISLALAVAANDSAGGEHVLHRAHQHQARQDSTGVTNVEELTGSTHAVPAAAAASSSSASSALVTPAPAVSATDSFSLAATNPTAVPLSEITAMQSSFPTQALPSTATPGSQPTFISGAPALPNTATILPSNYPTMDKPPPVDSAEVQQWKQEVMNSGITIPDFEPTNDGGCANNTAAAADSSRCWWSCSGCTATKDIVECPDPLSWGLTYDDGPGFYTSNLLQYLNEKDLKSTFFVVGSRAIQFPGILQAQYMGQHQIAVHTWSHQPLTTQTNDQIIAELGWSKKVIKDILGVTPNMMRPPFGDIDNRVRAISLAMGLTPVIWTRTSATSTFDTDGKSTFHFNIHNGATPVQKVLQNWQNILASASSLDHGFIVLEHDLFEESVEVATGYILPDALAHNPPFKIQPVISCLGYTLADAYIETNNNSTNPPATSSSGTASSDTAGKTAASDAGRQYPLGIQTLATATLIVGSGFVFGLFAALRI